MFRDFNDTQWNDAKNSTLSEIYFFYHCYLQLAFSPSQFLLGTSAIEILKFGGDRIVYMGWISPRLKYFISCFRSLEWKYFSLEILFYLSQTKRRSTMLKYWYLRYIYFAKYITQLWLKSYEYICCTWTREHQRHFSVF